MKIVVLEAASLGKGVSLEALKQLGEVTVYQTTTPQEIGDRVRDAEILVINKIRLNEETLSTAEKLKFITITSTGVDCIDLQYTDSRNIPVANMKGYSTGSVAQHTFALALYLLEKLDYYNSFVKDGSYSVDTTGSYYNVNYNEIAGKRWGIVGLGAIGKRVAQIAQAFGAEVIYYSVSGKNEVPGYQKVSFEELVTTSDIISVHTPLTPESCHLFTFPVFQKMKPTAIFINMARGAIANEKCLARALAENVIAAAGLDVFEKEPLDLDSPILKIQDNTKLVLSPHVGWASVESRQRSIDEVYRNIEAYLQGIERNIVHAK